MERPTAVSIRRSRPPNPLDRIALHLGVALIIWSRRGRIQPDRAELIRRHGVRVARERRESEYQRSLWLTAHR
jgi:hypothetical protein